MKRFRLFLLATLAICFVFSAGNLTAQEDNAKIIKRLKKDIKRTTKQVKKEAKALKKDGYYVAPGYLMSEMLEKSYLRTNEEDEEGYPRWITAQAAAVANSKIAAKNQAMEAAKLELAGQLETTIVALVENSFANEQINQEEAASLTKTVTGSKNIISKNLGRVVVFFEAYRDKGRNVEATVTIAYDTRRAMDRAASTIKKELKEDAEAIHDKLDKMLDFPSTETESDK
ncbi:MAG: hypothetical protein AAF847_01050 [Bacteroidota bacterium]